MRQVCPKCRNHGVPLPGKLNLSYVRCRACGQAFKIGRWQRFLLATAYQIAPFALFLGIVDVVGPSFPHNVTLVLILATVVPMSLALSSPLFVIATPPAPLRRTMTPVAYAGVAVMLTGLFLMIISDGVWLPISSDIGLVIMFSGAFIFCFGRGWSQSTDNQPT